MSQMTINKHGVKAPYYFEELEIEVFINMTQRSCHSTGQPDKRFPKDFQEWNRFCTMYTHLTGIKVNPMETCASCRALIKQDMWKILEYYNTFIKLD